MTTSIPPDRSRLSAPTSWTRSFRPPNPWARKSSSTGIACAWWEWRNARARSSAQSQDNFVWTPITAFRKSFGSRRSVTIQAEAQSMAVFEQAQDQARLALRNRRHLEYSAARRLQHRNRGERHGPVEQRDPGHLRGDHRGHRNQPARGRGGGDEHHAGLGHGTDQGDRRSQGPGRPPPGHSETVHRRVGPSHRYRGHPGRASGRACFRSRSANSCRVSWATNSPHPSSCGRSPSPSCPPPWWAWWPGSIPPRGPPPSTRWSP